MADTDMDDMTTEDAGGKGKGKGKGKVVILPGQRIMARAIWRGLSDLPEDTDEATRTAAWEADKSRMMRVARRVLTQMANKGFVVTDTRPPKDQAETDEG